LDIGSFVAFASGVQIYVGGEHFTEYVSTYPFSEIFDDVPKTECIKSKGNIVIGSDVWVGTNSIILSGVTIGHGAVIGAGSIVSKDIAPYTIVAGNPIREIRKRFTEEQIQKLLELKWWEWDDEHIDELIPLLMSENIETAISFMELEKEGEVGNEV
jgi:acetyltransferase-like isoleucine patch superfamily enzyme